MAITYTNVAYDIFMKNIELLLEAEFLTNMEVYISEFPQENKGDAIRLWYLGFEGVEPTFLAVSQEYRHSAEVVISMDESEEMQESIDARLEVMSRAVRLLNNNKNYSPSSVYKWHDGLSDEGEKQEAEINDETGLKIKEEGWRFIYSATVTEPIA